MIQALELIYAHLEANKIKLGLTDVSTYEAKPDVAMPNCIISPNPSMGTEGDSANNIIEKKPIVFNVYGLDDKVVGQILENIFALFYKWESDFSTNGGISNAVKTSDNVDVDPDLTSDNEIVFHGTLIMEFTLQKPIST